MTSGSIPDDLYRERTPSSRRHFERAARLLPGGTTRTTVFYPPYPVCLRSGSGCRVYDLDGNEYVDFLNNYTSLILGHADPGVVDAVTRQVREGSAFAAPTEREVELAERIHDRVPAIERIRFTNSGTEATMFAMRLARGYTGRSRIGRFVGGYHGTHDFAIPAGTPGLPEEVSGLVLELPYNDEARTEELVRRHAGELAGLVVEPILGAGGVVPATPSFLKLLRGLCDELGIVLVFDEIIVFRVDRGGAQRLYGVTPDLTTLGKIIGGGYALAAFGGSGEIMELLDPQRAGAVVAHGGTFNGNPVAAVAGATTLDRLDEPTMAELNRLGEYARQRLAEVFERCDVPAQVTGVGSLFNIHWTPEPVVDHASAQRGNSPALRELVLQLVNEGYILAPRGMGAISTPMGEAEIDGLAAGVERAIEVLGLAGAAAREELVP